MNCIILLYKNVVYYFFIYRLVYCSHFTMPTKRLRNGTLFLLPNALGKISKIFYVNIGYTYVLSTNITLPKSVMLSWIKLVIVRFKQNIL